MTSRMLEVLFVMGQHTVCQWVNTTENMDRAVYDPHTLYVGALDRTDRLHYEQLLRIGRIERFTTNVQYTVHIT